MSYLKYYQVSNFLTHYIIIVTTFVSILMYILFYFPIIIYLSNFPSSLYCSLFDPPWFVDNEDLNLAKILPKFSKKLFQRKTRSLFRKLVNLFRNALN